MNREWCRQWVEEMKDAGLSAEREASRPCRMHAAVMMGIVFAVFLITLWAGLSEYDFSGGSGGGTHDHWSDAPKP